MIRRFVLSLFVAGQLSIAAQPALAAELEGGDQTRLGMFGGLQVRMPLGGQRAEAPTASLGIAPIVRSQRLNGASRTRIGEGLQLRLRPSQRAELSFAGTRIDRLGRAPNRQGPGGQRAGVSTLGW